MTKKQIKYRALCRLAHLKLIWQKAKLKEAEK